MSFILALDEGTTSARAIVFDHAGSIRATAHKEFSQIYPQPGWVEHDPNEIWAAQIAVPEFTRGTLLRSALPISAKRRSRGIA
jgi:glycerol kinase